MCTGILFYVGKSSRLSCINSLCIYGFIHIKCLFVNLQYNIYSHIIFYFYYYNSFSAGRCRCFMRIQARHHQLAVESYYSSYCSSYRICIDITYFIRSYVVPNNITSNLHRLDLQWSRGHFSLSLWSRSGCLDRSNLRD